MAGKTDDDFLRHLGLAKPPSKPSPPPPKESVSSKKIAAKEPKASDLDFKAVVGAYLGTGQILGAQKLRESDLPKPPSPFKDLDTFRAQVTLDLHGLTSEKALGQLHWTIDGMVRKKQTLLRVICGKGLHSKEGPVLQKAVRDYLSHQEKVKRFESASPRLGGTGAYLVEIHA